MKKWLRSPLATALLFVLAAGLIGFGGIKGVQAAPRIETERDFEAQIQLTSISVAMLENGDPVGDGGTLLGDLQKDFTVGQEYPEVIAVNNDGAIDEYVRVTIYKYWVDKDGKAVDLDPSLIELAYEGGWTKDESSSTEEREVYYYASPLAPGDTVALTKTIAVSSDVVGAIEDGEHQYEGVTFQIKAVVDAVQTHNADQARTGAWGQFK